MTHVTDSTYIFKAVNIMLRKRIMYNKDWVFQEVSVHVTFSYQNTLMHISVVPCVLHDTSLESYFSLTSSHRMSKSLTGEVNQVHS